ncbi:MAG: type I secretion system permease/ATPase, partial [Ignavibacteria bacterium]
MSPQASTAPPKQPQTLFGVLLESRSAWTAVIAFSLVINFLMLAPSIYMLQVSDRVLTSRNMTTLAMISMLAVAVFIGMGALEWARSRILVRLGVRMDRRLGPQLLALSHRLGIEQNGGDSRRLLSDLTTVRTFLTGYGVLAMLDAPWVPIFFIVSLMLHPVLALVMLTGGLILVGLTLLTEKLTRKPLARANERGAEAARFANVNLRSAEVIEAMGMLPVMAARWQERQDEHLTEQAKASDRAGLISAATRFIRTTNQCAAMGVGAYLTMDGQVSPGMMMAGSLLASRMIAPIEMVISTWSMWGSAREAWGRIDEALATPEKAYSGVTLPRPKGEIVLENLTGGAPRQKEPSVKNVSLKIPAGVSVAVVGASASGKSSLMRMISGVWQPWDGVVRIDGADQRHWRREDLGPHIGYMPQDVELIEGTIAENIARHGELDSDKIIAAARAAGMHDMILQLPDGYASQVGSYGGYLSGGQRQRLGLARALYGSPSVLILDEPNANLD